MSQLQTVSPTVLVVFGTTGDLMARKIVPALALLASKDELPERFAVLGFGRRDWDDERLRAHVLDILETHASGIEVDRERFLGLFRYQHGQFDDEASFTETGRHIDAIEGEWGVCANKLYYLAVPPQHYATIFGCLAKTGLTTGCSDIQGWTRVLVEKPFGGDLNTARNLDRVFSGLFLEEQIYRIDHYLAKEMLQGVINFRFTNNLFECAWDRTAIERIDITLHEAIGAEKRGAFYDEVGALRDVGQNHLLQMLALVTMEAPRSEGAADIREARAELIEALRPPTPAEVRRRTFRAQHEGYREIAGVEADSETETFFRVETTMSGPRWAGVEVSMESGKRMASPLKRIEVVFRRPQPCLCEGIEPVNRIVFSLEPEPGIDIHFFVRRPGFTPEVEERTLSFVLYEEEAGGQYVVEYAKLLYDAFQGDQTAFVSTREVEAGWRFIDPIAQGWAQGSVPLEVYAADTSEVAERARQALQAHRERGTVGVCGFGKMGAGLARNLLGHDWRVVGWNRTAARVTEVQHDALTPAATLEGLVEALPTPRVIWLMVPAGAPVDALLFGEAAQESGPGSSGPQGGTGGLAALLSPGDVVIDGGNSHFSDAARRARQLEERGVHYMDCGTSGGPRGAQEGACLMIGGKREDFEALEPMFADVAAPGAYRHLGSHGAGHFAKMVHNGIEYGMMQAIAEGFEVLHASPYDYDLEAVAALYQSQSVVESRLVGWLEGKYAELGNDLEGASPVVGHSGEGEWTVAAALELGIPAPVIEESLRQRVESEKTPRYAGRVLTAMRDAFGGHGLGPGGGPRY